MTTPPFKIDVSDILENAGDMLAVEGEYPLDALVVGDESFSLLEPARVDVTINNAGTGLVASGTVTARVQANCSRCLCDFESVVAGEVEGFYVKRPATASGTEEAEPITPNGFVDLGPALLAALVIEAPFAPVHDPDCAGLCPGCGADLNEGPCGCAPDVDEAHPFAALKDMLGEVDAPS